MDFWESGMDLKHGDDIYDSFRAYQQQAAARVSARWATSSTSASLDARRSIDRIQDELRRQVAAFPRTRRKAERACPHSLTLACVLDPPATTSRIGLARRARLSGSWGAGAGCTRVAIVCPAPGDATR